MAMEKVNEKWRVDRSRLKKKGRKVKEKGQKEENGKTLLD